jgi:hypothetical protein
MKRVLSVFQRYQPHALWHSGIEAKKKLKDNVFFTHRRGKPMLLTRASTMKAWQLLARLQRGAGGHPSLLPPLKTPHCSWQRRFPFARGRNYRDSFLLIPLQL